MQNKNAQAFTNKALEQFPDIVQIENYTNAKTQALAMCKQGHKWPIIPSNLMSRGSGGVCPICTDNPKYSLVDGLAVYSKNKSHDTFAKQLQEINPEVRLTSQYKSAKTPVELTCSQNHTWSALPSNILNRGTDAFCSTCTDKWSKYRNSLEQASKVVQQAYSNLELLEYNGASSECLVKDTKCGHTFTSWFNNLRQSKGYRCTTCVPVYGKSKNEQAIETFIKSIYSGWVVSNDRTLIAPKELDIVVPDLGLAFEYNSAWTHHNKDHLEKSQLTQAMGFQLIHINEDEWLTKQPIVKSRIRSLVGASYKIPARKCTVQKIDFPREFLSTNHIQGAGAPTSCNYGLFFEGELVAVMTFAKPRFSHICTTELVRYCSLLDVTVVGGAGKLLKAFVKDYPANSILSYSDKRWSAGGLYKTLGFEYSHSSRPSYAYYKNTLKLSRFQCQKHLLATKFPEFYKPELTELEIMEQAGFRRMYDCGTDVWVYKV